MSSTVKTRKGDPYCLLVLSTSKMARHRRKCTFTNELETAHRRVDQLGANVTLSNVLCLEKK